MREYESKHNGFVFKRQVVCKKQPVVFKQTSSRFPQTTCRLKSVRTSFPKTSRVLLLPTFFMLKHLYIIIMYIDGSQKMFYLFYKKKRGISFVDIKNEKQTRILNTRNVYICIV